MSVDLHAVARARQVLAGLNPPGPRRSGAPRVADILTCRYDAGDDAFHIVYADLTAASVQRSELSDAGARQVAAWDVDEFRRGVEIVFHDGSTTSFSAEYPRYLRDPELRRQIDARSGGTGTDLGQRVASRVRGERERHGWSVAELARRADMAAPNVHRVESGKHVPSTTTIARLASALEVPVERLVRE